MRIQPVKIHTTKTERDEEMYHSYSRLNQLSLELESYIKCLVRKLDDSQKGYEQQLQKMEAKLRKHAKVEIL